MVNVQPISALSSAVDSARRRLVSARHTTLEGVEQGDWTQRPDGDVGARSSRAGLPGVEPTDAGAEGDLVEHPLHLDGGVGDPARPGSDRSAVGLDLVVGGRRIGAVDDEHRLAIEVAGAHRLGTGQRVVRRHGDVVDGRLGRAGSRRRGGGPGRDRGRCRR